MIVKMAAIAMFLASATLLFRLSAAGNVPVHQCVQQASRPQNDPYCQAPAVPFCPAGHPPNTMPKFNATDTLYVYSLKAPILELQLGDRLAKYNVLHDAIGFHHVQSGLNFTLEWHAIGQLLNGTFPHELDNQSLVWCNQGAACVSDGIDEKRWNADSTPVKVAELNGTTFNLFANWTEMDNNTNVFYQTWTVREEPGGKMWFDSCDASLWVQRAFAAMAESGASFNHSVHLNYTKIYLYSKTAPVLLGNADIFTDKKKVDIATEIRMFYHRFRPHQSLSDLLKSYVDTYYTIVELGRFILYYNQTYWQLNMTEPYVDVTYEEVSLP